MTFLANYIQSENPDIEEILLDPELLSEIKESNKVVLNYILSHFNQVISYLVEEPEITSSSKRSLNLPFIVSELLCMNLKDIQARLFVIHNTKPTNSTSNSITLENSAKLKSSQNKDINETEKKTPYCLSNTTSPDKQKFDHNSTPSFFDSFFKYINETSKETLITSTLPAYGFKIMKKLIKSNFAEFLKVFNKDINYNNLICCLQSCMYLDSAADILILLYANEVESYSDFKLNLTKSFNTFLNNSVKKLNRELKEYLNNHNKNENDSKELCLNLSISFDSIENLLKYFMKQMKVLTLIETDKDIRNYIIIEILFKHDYLDSFKEHLAIIRENWNMLKGYWEISRSINSVIHYITTSIIYLSNKKDFDDENLENYLSMFLFDEIMDLDLLTEAAEGTESNNQFKNNFYLAKESSHNIINIFVKNYYAICVDICNVITDLNNNTGSNSFIKANIPNVQYNKASQFYLLTLDFTILILLNHEIDHSNISLEFLNKITKDFNRFHSNSFFLNKVIKIFKIIAANYKNNNSKIDNCLYSKFIESNILNDLLDIIDLTKFVDVKNKKYSNKNYQILNSAQSYLAVFFMLEIEDLEKRNPELKKKLEEKKEIIMMYKDLFNFVMIQDRQPITDLQIGMDEISKGSSNDENGKGVNYEIIKGIDRIDCKCILL